MLGPIGTVLTHIRHILHPTDFSPASMAAFGHALKLGLGMKSDLTIMHVDPVRADPDFENFPRVRATLGRWGVLRVGNRRRAPATGGDPAGIGKASRIGTRALQRRAEGCHKTITLGRRRLDDHFCSFVKTVTCSEKFSMILVASTSPSSR
jgi:hypothetical protein